MRRTSVARRYAKALIEIGQDDGNYEKLGSEMRDILAVFKGNPELMKVLLNPMYGIEERSVLIKKVGGAVGAGEVVEKFLNLLVEARNINLIEEICTAYFVMEDELCGRLRVHVSCPVELTDKLVKSVRDKLGKETGKQIIVTHAEDPALIGGPVIRIGNTLYDGSMRGQLSRIKEKLLEGVSK